MLKEVLMPERSYNDPYKIGEKLVPKTTPDGLPEQRIAWANVEYRVWTVAENQDPLSDNVSIYVPGQPLPIRMERSAIDLSHERA